LKVYSLVYDMFYLILIEMERHGLCRVPVESVFLELSPQK
jgi:hypothetical protein